MSTYHLWLITIDPLCVDSVNRKLKTYVMTESYDPITAIESVNRINGEQTYLDGKFESMQYMGVISGYPLTDAEREFIAFCKKIVRECNAMMEHGCRLDSMTNESQR